MNIRTHTLQTAESLINGDRNNQYGPPTQDFERTAQLWSTYLEQHLEEGRSLRGHDVAAMMILLKLSRISWSPEREDNWIDIAGYAACGNECTYWESTTLPG